MIRQPCKTLSLNHLSLLKQFLSHLNLLKHCHYGVKIYILFETNSLIDSRVYTSLLECQEKNLVAIFILFCLPSIIKLLRV